MTAHDPRLQARRALAWYFAFALLGSVPCYLALMHGEGDIEARPLLPLVLMWVPALSALLARTITGVRFDPGTFALRGARARPMLLLAWLAPLAVGFSAYPLAWLSGLERFAPPEMASLGLQGAAPGLKLAASVAVNLTVGTALAAVSAMGEELGWRGYMLPRLIDAGVPRPVLISGVVWAGWHLPLIVSGEYAVGRIPWLSPPLFALTAISASFLFARVRLESGSVWPAVLLHSSWNALIQGTFDHFTQGGHAGRGSALWTGESGILVAVATLVACAWLTRGAREPRPVSSR